MSAAILTRAVEQATEDYWKRIETLAEQARTEVVLPFCRVHKMTFLAGMGTWCFYRGDEQFGREDIERMRGTRRLLAVLTLDIDRQHDLGHLIPDVKEEDL